MTTRSIMIATAALFGAVGAALLFAPLETAAGLGLGTSGDNESTLKMAGALCFAFAFLDWNGRSAIYGGIYGRPIAMANLLAGVFLSLELAQAQWGREAASSPSQALGWVVSLLFLAQTVAFVGVVFSRPWVRSEAP